MKNFAEFQILGRVGKIKEFDGKVNVTVCANYPTKKDGETRDNPHWNEVSIFAEAVRGYATKYAKAGDRRKKSHADGSSLFQWAEHGCWTKQFQSAPVAGNKT